MPIIDRRTKLKARRAIRKQKRIVESVGEQVDQDLNRHIFRRFARLQLVKRFVAVWTILVVLLGFGSLWQVRGLDRFYLDTVPVAGGVYREGIIGTFTNSNPLFATTSVDSSVSRLIFSSLFKVSPTGELVGDLAQEIVVDDKDATYTVTLREDVRWHDGEKLTAEDVVFTYKTIQNPASRSPLRSSWSGVSITSPDERTVVFALPNSLSSFRNALVNGIVPKHILGEIEAENLRSSNFNTIVPVGTGPYRLSKLEVSGTSKSNRQERIALVRNESYYGDRHGLDSVIIQSYKDEEKMLSDFDNKIIQSMVGLTSISDKLLEQKDVKLQQSILMSSVMIFFNNSSEFLQDKAVRQALTHATNPKELRSKLSYESIAVDSPFLRNQFAYNPEIVQLAPDIDQAMVKLSEAGWELNAEGLLEKEGKILSVRLVSQSLSEYASISQKLQQDWTSLGIQVEAILQPEEDIQTGALVRHDYDVLLYGISIGHDPDVFAYWHSSQADPNSSSLNLSEFKNKVADESLEAGRTRTDEALRKVKYESFLREWREEAPAVALYQPRFIMVTRGTFVGFESSFMTSATDRYWSVANWKVRNAEVVKQ
jgi:peptide/nickel transport system substrate-binding protein